MQTNIGAKVTKKFKSAISESDFLWVAHFYPCGIFDAQQIHHLCYILGTVQTKDNSPLHKKTLGALCVLYVGVSLCLSFVAWLNEEALSFYGYLDLPAFKKFTTRVWLPVGAAMLVFLWTVFWIRERKWTKSARESRQSITRLKAKLYEQAQKEKSTTTKEKLDVHAGKTAEQDTSRLAMVQLEVEEATQVLSTFISFRHLEKTADAAELIAAALQKDGKVICFAVPSARHHARYLVDALNRMERPSTQKKRGLYAVHLADLAPADGCTAEELNTLVRSVGKKDDLLLGIQSEEGAEVSSVLSEGKKEGLATVWLGVQEAEKADVSFGISAQKSERAGEIHLLIIHVLVRLTQSLLKPPS